MLAQAILQAAAGFSHGGVSAKKKLRGGQGWRPLTVRELHRLEA